jgi:hypothetical protein
MNFRIRKQHFERIIKSLDCRLDLDWVNRKVAFQYHQMEPEPKGRAGTSLVWLKRDFPIFRIERKILVVRLRVNINLHGRSFLFRIRLCRAGKCLRACQPAPFCGRDYRRKIFACQ